MGELKFKSQSFSGNTPAIWRGECKVLPGGFKPAQDFPVGTVLMPGAPLVVDFDNRTAALIKVAKVVTGGTTTQIRVDKHHYFAKGDRVMKVGLTTVSPLITNIDTSNTGYDVITVDKAITGVTADDILQECSAYEAAPSGGSGSAVDAAPLYDAPNAVVSSPVEFNGKGLPTIDAAYEAVVRKDVVGVVKSTWLQGVCLKNNPNIIYIIQ